MNRYAIPSKPTMSIPEPDHQPLADFYTFAIGWVYEKFPDDEHAATADLRAKLLQKPLDLLPVDEDMPDDVRVPRSVYNSSVENLYEILLSSDVETRSMRTLSEESLREIYDAVNMTYTGEPAPSRIGWRENVA